DALVREVAHVRLADDRHHVVLAVALEADVGHDDHLVVALDLAERAGEHVAGILLVAGEEFLVGAHHPAGRIEEPFAGGIVAGPADQRANRRFGLFTPGTLRRAGSFLAGHFPADGSTGLQSLGIRKVLLIIKVPESAKRSASGCSTQGPSAQAPKGNVSPIAPRHAQLASTAVSTTLVGIGVPSKYGTLAEPAEIDSAVTL